MKANETPEKIYISTNSQDGTYYISNQYKRLIEYTRIDAFIEKACEFINKANLYLYHCVSEECDLVDTDKMIEDFRKYTEGQ